MQLKNSQKKNWLQISASHSYPIKSDQARIVVKAAYFVYDVCSLVTGRRWDSGSGCEMK